MTGLATGIGIEVKAPSEFERLDSDVELALFRVLQEAMSNVHRHSGSARSDLRLAEHIRDAQRAVPARQRTGSVQSQLQRAIKLLGRAVGNRDCPIQSSAQSVGDRAFALGFSSVGIDDDSAIHC